MKSYYYKAYDAEGRRKTGVIVAEDESDASRQLNLEGYFPEEIGTNPEGGRTWFTRGNRSLDADLQTLFARQMAVLISSGLPVDRALDVIRNADGGRTVEQVATRARALVLEGEPLSRALDRAGSGFPPYVISAIRAGETSRDLVAVLETVADHLETRRSDRAVLATALVYPAFVAAASLVVCSVLMTTVAPQLAEMFEATGKPLPALTAFLMGATDFIRGNLLPIGALTLALVIGVSVLWRRPQVRDRLHAGLLRIPVIGRLMRLEAASQYLRTLALVVGSRQPVVEGMLSAGDVLSVRRFIEQSNRATAAIRAGSSLSAALVHTSFVPGVARELIEAGERSARVAMTTERAADLIESWLVNDRRRLAALIDPMLMMLIGGFVLLVVLSVLLPIMDLQSAISV